MVWKIIDSKNKPFLFDLVLFFIIALLITVFRFMAVEHLPFGFERVYVRMANNPFIGQGTPYGCRLLTPLLVYLLPFSLETGYSVINGGALTATAVITAFICRHFRLSTSLSIAAMITFLLSAGVTWQLSQIWFNDAISHLFLALMFLCFIRGDDGGVSLFSLLGIMNRTSALYFMPVWYAVRYGWKITPGSLLHFGWVWMPAIGMYGVMNYIWHPLIYYSYEASFFPNLIEQTYLEFFHSHVFEHTQTWTTLFNRLFSFKHLHNFFGTILPFFIYGMFYYKNEYVKHTLWILIVWMQFFVALDLGRLETISFPVVIPLALIMFQSLLPAGKLSHGLSLWIIILALWLPNSFWTGLAMLFALIIYKQLILQNPVSLNGLPSLNTTASNGYKISRRMSLTAQILIYGLFMIFMLITYSVRPVPLLSMPYNLLGQDGNDWELALYNRQQQSFESFQINGTKVLPLTYLVLDEDVPIMMRLPDNLGSCKQIAWVGNVENVSGSEIYLAYSKWDEDKVYPAVEVTIPMSDRKEIYTQVFDRNPELNAFIMGGKPGFNCQIQFMVYDFSKLWSMNKTGY